MNLISFFFLRLKRQSIFLAIFGIIILIPVTLTYRNTLIAEQLRFEDRTRIIRIKKEAETVLYAEDNNRQPLDSETRKHYETLLTLTTDYLEKEYLQGKSQVVLETELEIYQTLQAWEEKGRSINHITSNELKERIAVYSQVTKQSLSFQYASAPRDFYMTLLQILPVSNYLLPLVTCCLIAWMLFTDLSKHRGLLFINGLSPRQYANSLTLLALLIQLTSSVLLLLMFIGLSHYFQFTFQHDYPLVAHTEPLSTVIVWDSLQKHLLEMLVISCFYLFFIGLLTPTIIKNYRKQ